MKTFIQYLKEAASYVYKVPKDRETQLYDFYLISLYYKMLEHTTYQKHVPESTIEDLRVIINEAVDKITQQQKKDLLDATLTAISSEMRHATVEIVPKNSQSEKDLEKELIELAHKFGIGKEYYKMLDLKFIKKLKVKEKEKHFMTGTTSARTFFRKALEKTKTDPVKFVSFALHVFSNFHWPLGYGGKSWANVAQGWLDLYKSNTIDRTIEAIDHIYDLEHNNGIMLNKIGAYAKEVDPRTFVYADSDPKEEEEPEYLWIRKALDLKFNASVWQLAEKSSLPRNIVGMLNRITGSEDVNYDQFLHQREKESLESIKKPFKKSNKKHVPSLIVELKVGIRKFLAKIDSYNSQFSDNGDKILYSVSREDKDYSFGYSVVFYNIEGKRMKISFQEDMDNADMRIYIDNKLTKIEFFDPEDNDNLYVKIVKYFQSN